MKSTHFILVECAILKVATVPDPIDFGDDTPLYLRLRLPGPLPQGENILWHGKPQRRALAHSVFKTHWATAYLAILAIGALLSALLPGRGPVAALFAVIVCAIPGLLVLILLQASAWVTARNTQYIITDRRVILMIGTALTKMVNIPLHKIVHAESRQRRDGSQDIAMTLEPETRIGWFALVPHTRFSSWNHPQPMFLALPADAPTAAVLTDALMVARPGIRHTPSQRSVRPAPLPDGLRPHHV